MKYANGIEFYVIADAHIKVPFPEGFLDCRHCPFRKYEPGFETFRCKLTDEFLEKSNLNERGKMCPCEFPYDEKPTF